MPICAARAIDPFDNFIVSETVDVILDKDEIEVTIWWVTLVWMIQVQGLLERDIPDMWQRGVCWRDAIKAIPAGASLARKSEDGFSKFKSYWHCFCVMDNCGISLIFSWDAEVWLSTNEFLDLKVLYPSG